MGEVCRFAARFPNDMENEMKTNSLFLAVAAGACFAAFAGEFVWNGGGSDSNWTTPQNWGKSAVGDYPKTDSDIAVFNGAAGVTLDTGTDTTISYLKVTAGTVTIDGTTGSTLNCTKAAAGDASGLVVASGATLIVKVPMPFTARMDKWGTGTLIVRDAAITKSDGAAWYLAHGTNIFDGTASVTFPYATICFGNGTPYDYLPVFIRDSAQFNVKGIDTAASTPGTPLADFIQEGADTVVTVGASGITLNSKRATEPQRYTLKSGTLAVAGPVWLLSPNNPSAIEYVQEGGTSTFAKVSCSSGSAALRGGVMNFTGENADFIMGSGTTFEISGGTLAWPRTFNPSGWPQFRYSGRFGVTVPSGSEFSWDWSRAHVAPGTVFVYDGPGNLKLIRGISTEGVGLELAEGKTVTVDSWCTISAPPNSVEPWKLTVNNGSVFKLNKVNSRLALPLDLTVNGTGCIQFNGFRGAAIAHRLTVNGVEKPKGIYTESQSFVDAAYSSYICVPYVWTGAGDGESWSDGRNWDAGVPPSSTGTGVDVSRATRPIVLNDDVTVGCLAAMPNGTERKVEITGSGSISISAAGYGCAIYIPEACELALGVDLKPAANNQMALLGGGKLTLKKSVPSTTTSANPLLLLDGTMVLEGVKTLNAYPGSTHNRFTHHTTFTDVKGEVVIADGTEFTCSHLLECNPGFISAIKVRQTGGNVTFNSFGVQNYNGSTAADDIGYILEGGSLTIPLMQLGANAAGSSSKRYPGGSFEMSGGTLTCEGITASKNQNYVRLYGGDVYLKGNCKGEIQDSSTIQTLNENAITFYLGGVKFHPVDDHRWLTKGNICLTGKNGNCKFMLDGDYAMAIDQGMEISGPGGIEMYGNYRSLTCKANCTFTGSVIVHGGTGAIIFDGYSTLNGPSEFIVEDPASSISVGGTVTKSPERIIIASENCIQGSKVLHVKHLVVAGEEKSPGTYCNGKVIVDAAPASWLDGTVGDLSYQADGTTTVANATTLSSLSYYPGGTNATNTLTGAALTFSDGANIYVAKGDTLVIDNDVVLGGKVTKTGEGEVVFNGGVTAAVAATDGYWLTVEEGGATFDGAVTGVRLITCGTGKAPIITLNENCTVTDYALVLTAFSHDNSVKDVMGETHQNGATVDYSAGVFETIRTSTDATSKDIYPLTNPNGGSGRYVLNSGTFRTSGDWKLSFMQNAGELGTFEFVQNGGRFYAQHQITFGRTLDKNLRIAFTINDGYAEFTRKSSVDYVAGTLNTINFINFNGGTVVFSGLNDSNFAVRQFFTVTVGGDVTFEQASTHSVRFPNDWAGTGTATFNGGSFYFGGGLNLGGLNLAAGSVTLGENTALAATGGTALSLTRTGATLNLDYDGQMPFKTLTVDGQHRAAGVYSATTGRESVRAILDGGGELLILEGSDPGTVISIR